MESETKTQLIKNTEINHTVYIIVILALFFVIAGGYYYFNKQMGTLRMGMVNTKQVMGMENGRNSIFAGKGKGMRTMMIATTPPPLSDQQTQQLAAGVSAATTQKTFNIIGGNFYFVPNKITVNAGDQVTLVLTNAGGVHDIAIDELGVKTPVIRTANTATVQFTASKKGSFIYYCDVPGHSQKGMWGALIVQ